MEVSIRGAKVFEGAICDVCGTAKRYVSNRNCVACHGRVKAEYRVKWEQQQAERGKKIKLPQPKPEDGISNRSMLAVLRWALSGRLEERESGFWLDARPVSFDDVVRAANVVLVQWGYGIFAAKPEWLP